jgi:hypothetical protein
MDDISYPECIRELLDSEILGEAAFLALYEVAKTPTEKYQFGTLLQLETETKMARETDAAYGGVLYVDSLSAASGAVPTYLDLLRVTSSTVVKGLSEASN